jgi:myo-inositol-1(or 4)-monophosphatase
LPQLKRRLQGVLEQCADVRRLGSAALDICWVALGRLDAYYESVSCWDFAAAQLIAREAGARFGHFLELPEGALPEMHGDNLLIANPHIYDDLKIILSDAQLN